MLGATRNFPPPPPPPLNPKSGEASQQPKTSTYTKIINILIIKYPLHNYVVISGGDKDSTYLERWCGRKSYKSRCAGWKKVRKMLCLRQKLAILLNFNGIVGGGGGKK